MIAFQQSLTAELLPCELSTLQRTVKCLRELKRILFVCDLCVLQCQLNFGPRDTALLL